MIEPVSLQLTLYALASTPTQSLDSSELAQQIRDGNHKAFQSFFDLHYDSLLRFLISKNTSREDARDLIQKAFIYIWEHRNKIDPEKSLRAYIFQIAYTRMLNHHSDNKKFSTDEAVPNQQTNHTPEDSARANVNNRSCPQNEQRLGNYYRTDVSAEYNRSFGDTDLSFSLSIFNVFDSQNPWYRELTFVIDQSITQNRFRNVPVDVLRYWLSAIL